MTHLSLYIAVCRDLLDSNSPLESASEENWETAARRFRKLRQLLLCRICKQLSIEPYFSGSCSHLICKECNAKKKLYFPSCRSCRKCEGLVVDAQAVSVLSCYGKLCEILYNYGLSSEEDVRSKRVREIWNLVLEGVQIAVSFNEKQSVGGLVERNDDTLNNVPLCGLKHEHSGGHVCEQNNTTEDGGKIQDGACSEDGAFYDDTITKSPTKIEPMEGQEINEANPVATKEQKTDSDLDGIFEKSNDGEIDSSKFGGKLEILLPNETKMHPATEILEINNDDCLGLVKNEQVTNGEQIEKQESKPDPHVPYVDDHKLPSNHNSMKNGHLKQSFLLEKDVNRSPVAAKKRKLRFTSLSDSETKKTNYKTKRKKMVVNGNSDQLSKVPISDKKANDLEDRSGDGDHVVLNGGTHELDSIMANEIEHMEAHSNGLKKTNFDKSRKSLENSSLVAKTKLYRKNKYKCSCRTSGTKYYSDICKDRRCACYLAQVPCTNCKCHFCSNPFKPPNRRWSSFSRSSKTDIGV